MNKFYQGMLVAALVSAGTFGTEKAAAQSNNAANSNTAPIGTFTSVRPTGQTGTIVIPSETHAFQLLAKQGTTRYSGSRSETMPGNNDFTAYVGKNGSSKNGYLAINHETSPGGVSILDMHLNQITNEWVVGRVRKVDFSPLVKTERNCSGGITPWGTVITTEESYNTGDANGDGYQDVGWQVEIDLASGKVVDHDGDGKPDKLWALGRMNHENIAVGQDRVTVYQTEDGGSSGVYKFIANEPGKLSEGTLYVLKRDGINATTGTWVVVPNTTQAERNNTRTLAPAVGATNWNSAEDIEFGPDGKIYFTSKGTGTIWRFKDNGTTVSEIEAWVTRQLYEVKHEGGSQKEDWGTGIDNLTFDGEGNLWALQDGGRNNLWVIRPDHTPKKPHLELFMTTPRGSESTGLTFSPDFKYGFISIQHPNTANTTVIKDATGQDVVFNQSATIVFARKQFLGEPSNNSAKAQTPAQMLEVYPNPFQTSTNIKVNLTEQAPVLLEVHDMQGKVVETLHNGVLAQGEHSFELSPEAPKNETYLVRLQINNEKSTTRIVHATK